MVNCNPLQISLSLSLKEIKLENCREIHKTIIEASKNGDERQKYKLYQLYSKAMFNVCWRMMNNREEAEDMLQEAFTQAFLKLDTFRYDSSFGAWLKKITVNTCINAINKKKLDLTFMDEMHRFDQAEENSNDEEEIQLSVAGISKAMEKLPEGGRIVFLHREGHISVYVGEVYHIFRKPAQYR